jgi:hypothetical protein
MADDQKKYNQVENIIRRSKALILNVKLLGADTSHAKNLLDSAKSALDQGDYNMAIDYAKKSMVEVISLKKQVQAGMQPPVSANATEPGMVGENIEPENGAVAEKLGKNQNQADGGELDTPSENSEYANVNVNVDVNPNKDPNVNVDATAQTELAPQGTNIQETKDQPKTPKPPVLSKGSTELTEAFLSKFEDGFSYLIEENRADVCFRILSRFSSEMYKGLCICRLNPAIIKRKYKLNDEDSTVLWLTDRDTSKEATISASLESMIYVVEEFIDKNDKGIILLDGLEYLISNNSFNPVLRFIRRLIDKISETVSIMIIGVSPRAINEQELKLLERELHPVII